MACEAGLPRGVALMDAAYGNASRLRAGMTELGVPYVAGIVPNTLMWRSAADRQTAEQYGSPRRARLGVGQR